MSISLKEYRCKHCKKLFFKGNLNHCTIEVKCKKCKTHNKIEGTNCRLFLMLDQADSYGQYNASSFSSKDGAFNGVCDKCSGCAKKNSCESYKTMAEDKACPFCHK